jgi:hypothetical protein
MTQSDVPLRRLGLDRLVRDIDGNSWPDDDMLDGHLIELLDDAERALPHITFRRVANIENPEAARIYFFVDHTEITYDPAATLETANPMPKSFRTAALLHEVMHAICNRDYEKPPAAARDLTGWNFHFPKALGADFDRIGDLRQSQMEIAQKNLSRAAAKLKADRSKIITGPMRDYIFRRFAYSDMQPEVHYDSVLFELLLYMTLEKAQATPTFAFLKSLSAEARERRLEKRGQSIVASAG